MLLPLTEFTDYSETVLNIDNHWVCPYKFSLYYHTRVKFIFLEFGRPYVPYFGHLVFKLFSHTVPLFTKKALSYRYGNPHHNCLATVLS